MSIEDAIQFADDRPTSCDEVLYQWAVDAEEVIRNLAAMVGAQQPAPSAAAANTKTAELLSTTVGLLMGYREGGARQPYKPGSVVAKVIDEVVDHLKDWPYPEPTPTPQADSAPAEAVQRIVHLRADRERRVYVAGPMTGLPEYNFPLFNATAARLRSEGWHVENPAEHGHVDGAGWSDYLRWDISRIATCGAIYLLPGWSKSKGATLEVHIAGVLGLQVLLADGAEAPQADSQPAPAATPTAASIAWNALRDLTDPLGEAGVKIMGHVRIYAQRQYEAGLTEGRATPPAQAADSVLEDAARRTTEQEHAIRQGHEIAASDGYFEARPQIDSNDRRYAFRAGFERGWDAARKQGGAT